MQNLQTWALGLLVTSGLPLSSPFLSTANKALEVRLQEMDDCRDNEAAALKERIINLEKELENANELLSDTKLRGQVLDTILPDSTEQLTGL